jgi:pyridoxamine 5'-phosphate oxidase
MKSTFDPKDIDSNPIEEFQKLFARVSSIKDFDPTPMTLATVTNDGSPAARIVLLKEVSLNSFVFFTNYESHKGQELYANPKAALVFFWQPVYQQVRISGQVEKVSRQESEKYFQTRPRESQLAAVASAQSRELLSRDELIAQFKKAEDDFKGRLVECPKHWGGYRVIPNKIEFWFGSEHRLHDRVCYTRNPTGGWKHSFLSP